MALHSTTWENETAGEGRLGVDLPASWGSQVILLSIVPSSGLAGRQKAVGPTARKKIYRAACPANFKGAQQGDQPGSRGGLGCRGGGKLSNPMTTDSSRGAKSQ